MERNETRLTLMQAVCLLQVNEYYRYLKQYPEKPRSILETTACSLSFN